MRIYLSREETEDAIKQYLVDYKSDLLKAADIERSVFKIDIHINHYNEEEYLEIKPREEDEK
jgi:hypothetical protein